MTENTPRLHVCMYVCMYVMCLSRRSTDALVCKSVSWFVVSRRATRTLPRATLSTGSLREAAVVVTDDTAAQITMSQYLVHDSINARSICIDCTVVRHPTQGRADLFLPRNILNGEILVVKYTKHATNSSRWIGGEDGLFSDSWDRLVVENNVWPTLLNSYVPNENASIITLEFTGRGIVHGQR